MSDYLVIILPLLIAVVFLGLVIILFAIVRKKQRYGRRNPLTRDLLRNPGESLREKVEDLGLDLGFYPLALILLPFFLSSQLVIQYLNEPQAITPIVVFFYLVILMGFCIFFVVKTVLIWRKRYSLRLGLECEMAVGQELNQLMLLGCRVYHDFPADNFNIDHIVIGPAGVYAVETKGRAKPDKRRGSEDVRVTYDGKSLRFPDWSETKPIAQAKRQAQWLANWLQSAVGESVKVLPALALPGWYIDREAKDMVVFNSKNPDFLAKPVDEKVLSDKMIQRIAHQVEQRCRTVEPLSYSNKKAK